MVEDFPPQNRQIASFTRQLGPLASPPKTRVNSRALKHPIFPKLIYFDLSTCTCLPALVCFYNREIVDAIIGRNCHYKMANNRYITVCFSDCVGLIYIAI